MRRKNLITPLSIVSIVFLLINFYVFGGLKLIISSQIFSYIFWGFSGILVICAYFAALRIQNKEPDRFFTIAIHSFIIYLSSEILFSVFLFINDFLSFLRAVPYYLETHSFIIPGRSLILIEMGAVLSVFLCLLFIYGILWGKYQYQVIKHVLYFDDLPEAFEGFTITQISDIHAGSFNNARQVQKGIDLINKQHSDLFVFTGDLVNNRAQEIVPWINHFSQIKAKYGQFSVLGNHDYGDYVKWPNEVEKAENLQQLKDYHAQIGFRLLLDEHVTLTRGTQKIILAGIENWGIGFGQRGDLNKSLENTQPDDFKILLSHDPTHWEEEVRNHPSKIHLTLSGHTHGMQFGIEFFGIKWSPVSLRYKHWAGLKTENGRTININRGFGFLGFLGRVGIWPEITVIELRKNKIKPQ